MRISQMKILKYIPKSNLSLLFIVALLLIIPAVRSDQMTSVNITVAEKKSADITFSLNPATANANQNIDFIIVAANTGNAAFSVEPEIKIYRYNNLVANLMLTPTTIPMGGNVTFIATWNTDNNPSGNYTAVAAIYSDSELLNSTQNYFSIINLLSSHIEDWPAASQDALVYVKFPLLAELRPGETQILDVTMKSPIAFSNLIINISGVPSEWIEIFPEKIDIAARTATSFRLYASIPFNASPGDYRVAIKASNKDVETTNYFILRVKPYPPGYPAPTVTRIVTVDMEKLVTNVYLKIVNRGEFIEKIELIESIPKTIAYDTGQINFETAPKILEQDPVVQWIIEGLGKEETRVISYSIKSIPSEYSSYVYWAVKQINIYDEKQGDIKVSYASPESLSPNETGEIKLFITNSGIKPARVTAKIEAPPDWTVPSNEMTTTLQAGSMEKLIFSVTPPSSAELARYNLKVRVTYEGGEIIENIPILIQHKLPFFYIMLSLGLIVIGGGAYYLKRKGKMQI